MDILDAIIAKNSTKNNSIDIDTQKIVNDANAALKASQDALDNVDIITQQTEQNNQDAAEAIQSANTAAAQYNTLSNNLNNEIDKLGFNVDITSENDIATTDIEVSYPSGKKARIRNINKIYNKLGNNTDGTVTQKAITDAINASSGETGSIKFNAEDKSHVVAVDDDGSIKASEVTELGIIKTQIITGIYENKNAVGLEIDYVNRNYNRLAAAKTLSAGTGFDKFTMYGGRKRCIVNREGQIVRFLNQFDDENTILNQRVMVYQPAFYYLRVPISLTGSRIDKEHIYLSDVKSTGFKLHPAFIDKNGKELRYILMPAFESGTYRVASNSYEKNDTQDIDLLNDCLVSIIGTKPISGMDQHFTSDAAEKMAENNGEGWSITNLEFESLNQMLMMVEYGGLNMQELFNIGLTRMTGDTNYNIASLTGSTLSLMNTSGQAEATTNVQNDVETVYNEAGKCSISYRGVENLYGNIWRFINGLSIVNKEIIYNNEKLSFKIPSTSGWINGFGYDSKFDWIYLPIEVGGTANNAYPVGDHCYTSGNDLTTEYSGIIGGYSTSAENAGLFYYSFNLIKNDFHYQHDSARVMFTPIADSIIDNSNYEQWYNSTH